MSVTKISPRMAHEQNGFDRFFRIVSYAAVFFGFCSLWISGSIGSVATLLFISAMTASWLIEGSRWQIGEKLGTGLIVLALPIFYGVWQMSNASDGVWIAGLLARMILCLTSIKLLQLKSDRDWIFLYLMSFFELLLGAGLSISGLYLINLIAYLLLMACAIIAFEIRKTAAKVQREVSFFRAADVLPPASTILPRVRRVPYAAVTLIILTVVLAVPLFFALPRVGGAGLGSTRRGQPVSGFTDKVTLGQFGRITEDDSPVMWVKFDDVAAISSNFYFRGIALDEFDNKSWSRSRIGSRPALEPVSPGSFSLEQLKAESKLLRQTIYLEPVDGRILFALPRPIAIQGNFESLSVDAAGSIQHSRPYEPIYYQVTSDVRQPDEQILRDDRASYTTYAMPYRSLPEQLDARIPELAEKITKGQISRYDKARAVEAYLQTRYGYTLEQKASGDEPLADFLFNAREGHCEYFASAMAILLRTQGIATRVVNGFHGGDYNETSGFTVVRRRHAHAWVEVLFPGENVWVTFDPTPIASQPGDASPTGALGAFAQYAEAIEAFWIENFVAFDDRGQESLKTSARGELARVGSAFGTFLSNAQQGAEEWVKKLDVRDVGAFVTAARLYLVGAVLLALILIYVLYRFGPRRHILSVLKAIRDRIRRRNPRKSVAFYETMLSILAHHGFKRSAGQTPLEFAIATNLQEAVAITTQYQEVRFGRRELSESESAELSQMLKRLEVWSST